MIGKIKVFSIQQFITGRLRSFRAAPRQVAGAYALGFFLGTTPLVGCKVWIALILSTFLRLSRPAAVFGVYHINALTGPLYYTLAFFIGKAILGFSAPFQFPKEASPGAVFEAFFSNGAVFLTLLSGGLVIGIPISLLLYYFSFRLLQKVKHDDIQS